MKYIRNYMTLMLALLITFCVIIYFWSAAAITIAGIKTITYRKQLKGYKGDWHNRTIDMNRIEERET